MIDRMLKKAKRLKVDLLVDMRRFKGWGLLAVRDDMKFGLKHRNAFDKTAVVGNKKWEALSLKMFAHMMKGKAKFFKDRQKALAWLLKES